MTGDHSSRDVQRVAVAMYEREHRQRWELACDPTRKRYRRLARFALDETLSIMGAFAAPQHEACP